MNPALDGSAKIIHRMEDLRSVGIQEVERLHDQAVRMTDWREHVNSRPVLSTLAAAVIGFALVRTFVGNKKTIVPAAPVPPQDSIGMQTATAGLLSVVGGIAVSVGRQLATEYIHRKLRDNFHGTQSTHPDQRSSSANV